MRRLGSNAAILTAVVGVLIAAGMVADRFGAPASATALMVLMLAILSVAFAALTTRTMRVSAFRAAGHGQPLLHTALLAAGLGTGLAGLAPGQGTALLLPALAAVIGGLLLHLPVAGALRRSGATSLCEAVYLRFRSRSVALLVAALLMLPLGMLALAAGERAVALLAEAMHVGRGSAAGIVLVTTLLILLPGGATGLISVGLIFGAMALVAWGTPLAAVLALPDGTGGLALAETVEGLGALSAHWGWVAGHACVAAGLFTLLGSASAAASARIARGAPLLAALWLLATGLAAVTVQSGVALATAGLAGKAPADLPAVIYSERARGLVSVCGVEPVRVDAVQRACARASAGGEARIEVSRQRDGRWLAVLLGLPVALGTVHALALPLLLVFVLAGLLHALGMLLTHDVIYRLGDYSGTASGRLALNRLILTGLALLVVSGRLPALAALQPLVLPALFLTAAIPVPMLLLAVNRRADWRAALCGLVAAGAVGGAIVGGLLTDAASLLAAAGAALAAGAAAAWLFASTDPADAAAADILAGRAPGPLHLDRSA